MQKINDGITPPSYLGDYLTTPPSLERKLRRKARRVALVAYPLALLAIAAVIASQYWIVGRNADPSAITYTLGTDIDGNTVILDYQIKPETSKPSACGTERAY